MVWGGPRKVFIWYDNALLDSKCLFIHYHQSNYYFVNTSDTGPDLVTRPWTFQGMFSKMKQEVMARTVLNKYPEERRVLIIHLPLSYCTLSPNLFCRIFLLLSFLQCYCSQASSWFPSPWLCSLPLRDLVHTPVVVGPQDSCLLVYTPYIIPCPWLGARPVK